jgi:O-methyltransferase
MDYLATVGSHQVFEATLDKIATELAPTEGCFVEVGIYTGGSASHLTKIAEERNQKIFLYDTFSGLPYKDDDDPHGIGAFSHTDFDGIKNALPYAEVIKGIFPECVVEMPSVAFAHLDVDQYKSYIDCITYLKPKMLSGGIMFFDDYELPGAKRAIDELIGVENLKLIHLDWTPAVKVYTVF